MIVPREGSLLPSSRAQGLSGGGGGLDETDTCISHRQVKSDIFRITKQLSIKTILSVVQLVRLCQCSPAGRSFPGKERYCGEI